MKLGIKVDEQQLNQLPGGALFKITVDIKNGEKKGQYLVYKMNQDGTKMLVPYAYYAQDLGQIFIIANDTGQFIVESVKHRFIDLDRVNWAREAIEALAARGMIEGTSETTFEPSRSVTREQFIYWLMKVLPMNAVQEKQYFTDVLKHSYYEQALASAAELGIVQGYTNGSFGVGKELSRQDIIYIVH